MRKMCTTCIHESKRGSQRPCIGCSLITGYPAWEPKAPPRRKRCADCQHRNVAATAEPCASCTQSNWAEPQQPTRITVTDGTSGGVCEHETTGYVTHYIDHDGRHTITWVEER